jgi:hypothetical protein
MISQDVEHLRVSLDRIRSLLESIVVRGHRACGDEQLIQLRGYAEELEQSGAAHVASALSDLHADIVADARTAPRRMIQAQTSVRLLDRLLTLRVARSTFKAAAHLKAASDLVDGEETP